MAWRPIASRQPGRAIRNDRLRDEAIEVGAQRDAAIRRQRRAHPRRDGGRPRRSRSPAPRVAATSQYADAAVDAGVPPDFFLHAANDALVDRPAILGQLPLRVAIERGRPPVERALVALGSEYRPTNPGRCRAARRRGRSDRRNTAPRRGPPAARRVRASRAPGRPGCATTRGRLRDRRARPSDDSARAGSVRSPDAPTTPSWGSLPLHGQPPTPGRTDQGCRASGRSRAHRQRLHRWAPRPSRNEHHEESTGCHRAMVTHGRVCHNYLMFLDLSSASRTVML